MKTKIKLKLKIQSIEPQKRRKNRFTITFESGDVFGISEDVLLSMPLSIGQIIDPNEFEKIQFLESSIGIKNQVLILLSYRQRSRAELTRRLKLKGHPLAMIISILDELESKGFINDTDFAKMFATHLIENKKIGRVAVQSEFYPHQIPESVLGSILDDLYEKHPPIELVKTIISKKMTTRAKSQKEKLRMINFLKRKGFVWEDMESEIQRIEWDG